VLFDGNGAVAGVATGDMGVAKNGHHKDSFTRGIELRAKYTLFAEGARGSLTKVLEQRFALRQGREPQKFGLGLKELWQVAPEKHRAGLVQHTFGWPLDNRTGVARSFIISTTDSCRSASWCISITKIPIFPLTRNSNALRLIRSYGKPSRVARGSLTARAH